MTRDDAPLPETSPADQRPATGLGILQFIDNLDIGGAQEVVVTLSKALRASGHRAVVCSLRDGPLRADLEALDVPVVIVPDRRHSVLALPLFVADMVRIRRALIQIVDGYRIDVVQTHLLRAVDFVAASLRSRRGRPLVYWTFHNENFTLRREHLPNHRWMLRPKQLGYRILYRAAAQSVSGLVAVSDRVRVAMLENIGSIDEKIVVIPNGVDTDRYGGHRDRAAERERLGLPSDAVVMVMVATFKLQKGHVHLIDAATEVVTDHPELRILLIGDGELSAEMEQLADSKNLGGLVRFLGSRRDVPDILAVSDCFVLPSLWEGLPMALLEAMASGLPSVATDVSGTRQVVIPDVTGYLVPPGDSAALRDAMLRVLVDPVRAQHMGRAARRRVEEQFSARKQAAEHVRRFESDLSRRSAGRRSNPRVGRWRALRPLRNGVGQA